MSSINDILYAQEKRRTNDSAVNSFKNGDNSQMNVLKYKKEIHTALVNGTSMASASKSFDKASKSVIAAKYNKNQNDLLNHVNKISGKK